MAAAAPVVELCGGEGSARPRAGLAQRLRFTAELFVD